MAKIQSIETLEIYRVIPSSDSAKIAAEFSLPLTYFDTIWFKFHPFERVFFYQLAEHESTHTFFNSVLIPKLKHSLSFTLTSFLPIVGNIIWPADAAKPFILYTPNDSVSLIVAESNSDLNCLCLNEMQEAVALHPYIPELPVFDSKAAIIAFQITLFPSQGFSIGVSMHHAIFDAKSEAMFMRSWAHICKENSGTKMLPLELTPDFDRSGVDDPQGLDMFYLNKWLSSSDPNPNPKSLKLPKVIRDMQDLVRADFELSRQDITKLRQKIVRELNGDEEEDSNSIHLSTFVLSYAYVIVSMVKAKQLKRKGKVGFMFPVDCRSRLNPKLPTNYFGNCLSGNYTLIDTEVILEKNGIASVAKELREMVKELDTIVNNMSMDRVTERSSKFRKIMEAVDVMIGVAGSPRFEIYGTNFTWGKPKKARIVSIDKNVSISMAESRDGNGGIEVGLALKKNEMETFNSLFVNGLKD